MRNLLKACHTSLPLFYNNLMKIADGMEKVEY